ncbi:MAG: MBOAT family protein [Candidatus Cloacimonetes bacterium]|nr:MBOAT family protein [Candidatus Cloacimonadota bacterium]
MQFTSIPFFIFLFAVVIAYYVLPYRFRNYLLLLASYYFYFSIQAEYLVLLIASTAFNYCLGLLLEKYREKKGLLLSAGLIFNLGLLFFFKYFNFFGDQINALFSAVSLNLTIPHHSLILPIGISFYTFMAFGYVLDVYWGDIKAQKNLLTFSVYLAFFPQILSGPIGRAKNLFQQFTNEHPFLYENFSNGFRLMLWGLFKKMVVADSIGAYVDAVFNNIPMHSSLTLIVAAMFYPLQLYADFGGYTDIARGVGKLFGFDLMVNFRTPYVNSTSVTDYWKRNHISLTTWLKDYIFYPFMGMNTSKAKIYLGISLMFLVSGIWHGVGWMFIIWGLLQALLLIIEDATGWGSFKKGNLFAVWGRKIFTYMVVAASLVFFRLPDIHSLKEYIRSISSASWRLFTGSNTTILHILIAVVTLVIVEIFMDKKQADQWIASKSLMFRWSSYLIISLIIALIGAIDGASFIYFQF